MHAKAERGSLAEQGGKPKRIQKTAACWELAGTRKTSFGKGKKFPRFPDQMSFWLLLAFIPRFTRVTIVSMPEEGLRSRRVLGLEVLDTFCWMVRDGLLRKLFGSGKRSGHISQGPKYTSHCASHRSRTRSNFPNKSENVVKRKFWMQWQDMRVTKP